MTTSDLCTDALGEIGAARSGDVPPPEDLDLASRVLNRIFDDLNAEDAGVYADVFASFVLTPNLQPHTIGLAANTPTWTVTGGSRPEAILAANLILTTSTPNVDTKIEVRDRAWWMAQSVKTLTSAFPTDVFYSADWPNGSLYFWPVPTTAYSVRLLLRITLASLALTDTFTLPPGYQSALTLTLAEQLAKPFGQALTPDLVTRAAKARERVFRRNDVTPPYRAADAGIPGARGRGRGFNYLTRKVG